MQTPYVIVVATVWIYWLCVLALAIRLRVKFRSATGSKPRTRLERRMWRVWAPVIVLWQILPNAALHNDHWALAPLTEWPSAPILPWLAAVVAVMALLFTIPCWLSMGANWSMAIVPGKKTQLLTGGAFARVRHPIYALSMVLMSATMIALPSPFMLVVGVMHIVLLHLKAHSEEKFLLGAHPESYAEYCRRTGRFAPRMFVARA
jgi:protein-S-isoprenylcysteine O-methyltransferase Ste14